MDYSIGFAETYEILKYMDKNMLSKIPDEILNIINKYKSKDINFKYNKEKSLLEQKVHKETIEILSYLFYNFLSDEKAKKRLSKIYNENMIQIEKEKMQKFSTDIFKKN